MQSFLTSLARALRRFGMQRNNGQLHGDELMRPPLYVSSSRPGILAYDANKCDLEAGSSQHQSFTVLVEKIALPEGE
ncbi:hypothetical protein Pcinc_021790 [Petrolisthes cinctipes]|uniref:Uncharacterized protein n=1 Tax=Petrolisthes cinctipes TaxID=88211 RepID=A0AAE1FHA4_PETCI|nr:hypothetical protein Pcinc_021790 [Petrolisthes cinctipes]